MTTHLPDTLRVDLRQIMDEVFVHQFRELRVSLRADVHEELQCFLSASITSRPQFRQPRRFSTPSELLRSAELLHKQEGHQRPSLPPAPPLVAPTRSQQEKALHVVGASSNHDKEEGDQHAWMFRHIRRYGTTVEIADDDSDDGLIRVHSQLSKAAQRRAAWHSQKGEDWESDCEANSDGSKRNVSAGTAFPHGRSMTLDTCSASLENGVFVDPPRNAWNEVCSPPPPPPIITHSPPKGFRAASVKRMLNKSHTRKFVVEEKDGPFQQFEAKVVQAVRSHYFDYFICALIALNALTIGVQTNYNAVNRTAETPTEFLVLEYVFCVVFTIELLLRLFVFRFSFFTRNGWEWNVFDSIVVALQLVETFLGVLPNLSFVRMLRVMRLIRAIRLIRILRHITELRALVASIGASLASLMWTLVLLLLMVYMLSLCFTQLVVDHRIVNADKDDNGMYTDLTYYFGNVFRTMLTLFQAVSGGLDWDGCITPLTDHVSVLLAPVFSLYIAFTLLALMNVVTAIFVESVLETTKKDKNLFMANNVRELFNEVDGGINGGSMDWDTFEKKLDTQPMVEFFKAIDIDRSEATCLFRLLDLDNGGSVDAEEFLSGCLRLRGPAKALDLALLISEVGKLNQQIKAREILDESRRTSVNNSSPGPVTPRMSVPRSMPL